MPDGSGLTLPLRGQAGQEVFVRVAAVSVGGDTTLTNPDIRVGVGDSAAVVPLFSVPHGYYIYDVGWQVVTAFNANVIIALGDSDVAGGWASSADLGATVADTEIHWSKDQLGINVVTGIASTTISADTSAALIPIYGMAGRTAVADTVGDRLAVNATFSGTATEPTAGLLSVYLMYMPGLLLRRSST